MQKNFFDYIIILRVGKANVAKKEIYCVKKTTKIWDVYVDIDVIPKLIGNNWNTEVFVWIFRWSHKTIVLILPKMSGYVKTFKNKHGEKSKNRNNKLISLHMHY